MADELEPSASRSPLVAAVAKAYRAVWLTICATVAAVGIMVLSVLSPTVLLTVFFVFAVVGGVLMAAAPENRHPAARGARARSGLLGALACGSAASAAIGLTALLGAGVLILVLGLTAGSPAAIRFCTENVLAAASAPPPSAAIAGWAPGFVVSPVPGWAPPQLPPDLHLMSVEELCHAWCASYLILQERSSRGRARAVLASVRERQRYLDELERRNAPGLCAWLAAGATGSSDPLPYLVGNRAGDGVIDWDELT